MRVGELKYLKRRMEQKRGEATQKLKKKGGGGKLGQGVDALKRVEGLEPPYDLCKITML